MNDTYMNYRFRGEVQGRPPIGSSEEHGSVGSRTGTAESGLHSLTYGRMCGVEVVADTIKGEEPSGYHYSYGFQDRFHVYTTGGQDHNYNHRTGRGVGRDWMFTLYGDGRVKYPEPVVLVPDVERPTEHALHALVNVVKEHFTDPTNIPDHIELALDAAQRAMAGRRLTYDKAHGSPRP